MCELAMSWIPKVYISDIDFDLSGKTQYNNYMINTIIELQKKSCLLGLTLSCRI